MWFGVSRYGEGVASGRHYWAYVYRGVYRGVRMEGVQGVGARG